MCLIVTLGDLDPTDVHSSKTHISQAVLLLGGRENGFHFQTIVIVLKANPNLSN